MLDILNNEGFPLRFQDKDGEKGKPLLSNREKLKQEQWVSASQRREVLSTLLGLLPCPEEDEGGVEVDTGDVSDQEEDLSESEYIDEGDVTKAARSSATFEYSNPFLIMALLSYCSQKGVKPPEVHYWSSPIHRLQDHIPKKLMPASWEGGSKGHVMFHRIRSLEAKMDFLTSRTFWGHRLARMCYSVKDDERSFAAFLLKRLKCFLSGKGDPLFSQKRGLGAGSADADPAQRAKRLIQLLLTVDGIAMQKMLACPEVMWDWEKFDLNIIGNLAHLLGDEFHSGGLTEEHLDHTTAYESLKRVRKLFKSVSHREEENGLERMEGTPPWLFQFKPYYELVLGYTDKMQYCVSSGILSQSRGCGTPPPIVIAKSKMKFLNLIQTEPEPLTRVQAQVIQESLERIISKVPDHALKNTRFSVNVTNSASLEKTREEGGTVAAIKEILSGAQYGRKVFIHDLNTGKVKTSKTLEESTPGEYIFHRCLEEVLATPPELLRTAYALVVKEPGKGRTVTKGPACLKIVLDVVSKIVSRSLTKAFESSRSGMERSNHGWNLFRDQFRGPLKDKIFEVEKHSKVNIGGASEETTTFKDCFVSSTDYETATDYMHHSVALLIGRAWMLKCGIPKLLYRLVEQICFKPRKILFKGTSVFEKVGTDEGDPSIRSDASRDPDGGSLDETYLAFG